jgi:hypothetical protein
MVKLAGIVPSQIASFGRARRMSTAMPFDRDVFSSAREMRQIRRSILKKLKTRISDEFK